MVSSKEQMLIDSRVLVWAIDLDDGPLIEALGSGMQRAKAEVYPKVKPIDIVEPPFPPEESSQPPRS
jgi:hypothetical protein